MALQSLIYCVVHWNQISKHLDLFVTRHECHARRAAPTAPSLARPLGYSGSHQRPQFTILFRTTIILSQHNVFVRLIPFRSLPNCSDRPDNVS